MAHALNDDDDLLSSLIGDLEIEVLGLVTKSQKDKPQLCVEGNYFRVNYESKGKTTWRCCKTKCKASCCTYGQSIGTRYNVTFNFTDHNHTPDLNKELILEKRRKLKIQASLTDEAPRKILSRVVDSITGAEAVVNMPSYDADRQAINRAKAKVKPVYPPHPSELSDIELPEFLKHCISRRRAQDGTEEDGDMFLLHDSGVEDKDRFFMFGTEANVSHLKLMSASEVIHF